MSEELNIKCSDEATCKIFGDSRCCRYCDRKETCEYGCSSRKSEHRCEDEIDQQKE